VRGVLGAVRLTRSLARVSAQPKMQLRSVSLRSVSPSPVAGKKLRATFSDGSHTDFGAAGYSDYTQHRDAARRDRYVARHTKDLATADPTRPGFLAMFILWNRKTLPASIADYRRRLRTGDWAPPK
jgi:hypothetical protein